jgi:flagellar hook assembly protein FlgD
MPIEGIYDSDYANSMVEKTAIGSSGNSSGFDGDMFLKLLMTQLQNQDPFNTVETEKIMEQQAILTQVEQTLKQTNSLEDVKTAVDIGLADISNTLANINNTLNTIVENQNGGN